MPVYHQTKDRLKSYVLLVGKGSGEGEALWYGVVAASSRPMERQSCPYLPTVLRRLTGVTNTDTGEHSTL